jgi:hypothetical protein
VALHQPQGPAPGQARRFTLKNGGRIYPPKNGKIRRVDMSLQLADELRRSRAAHAGRALKKGWGAIPCVFVDTHGHPLRRSNFGRRVFLASPQGGQASHDPSSQLTSDVRVAVAPERGVCRLCEGSALALVDQDHRRHLRTPDPRREQGCGRSTGRDWRQPPRNQGRERAGDDDGQVAEKCWLPGQVSNLRHPV